LTFIEIYLAFIAGFADNQISFCLIGTAIFVPIDLDEQTLLD